MVPFAHILSHTLVLHFHMQELYPQHYGSSADDSSGDEEYPGGEPAPGYDEQWRLGETPPDDEFAHLSDLWEDSTPHAEGKGRKYTFSKQR